MVSQVPHLALPTLATSDNFSVLATMLVEREEIKAIANPENANHPAENTDAKRGDLLETGTTLLTNTAYNF